MPQVGELIDDTFLVRDFLGAGAAGEVCLVELQRNWSGFVAGTLFAMKWYKDEVFRREAEEVVYARRLRELSVGASVDCPYIVKVVDTSSFWVDGKPRYLLMEYLRGKPLDEWLKATGPLPSAQICTILWEIAQGVQALHNESVIHRDVKAANVMMTDTGRAVLLDLGVVRPGDEKTITASQAFLGTLRYAAPEWLFTEECREAADVYSLGTILYRMLAGRDVFDGITVFSRLVRAVEREEPNFKSASDDALTAYLWDLARLMLDKHPDRRPHLREVIEFVEKSEDSIIWRSLRWGRLRQVLHLGPMDNDLQLLLLDVPLDTLDLALARRDGNQIARLVDVASWRKRQRHSIPLSPESQELATQYLAVPPARRLSWVTTKLKQATKGDNDFDDIENRAHVMDIIGRVEHDEVIREQLRPLFHQADEEMTWMVRMMEQENPSF